MFGLNRVKVNDGKIALSKGYSDEIYYQGHRIAKKGGCFGIINEKEDVVLAPIYSDVVRVGEDIFVVEATNGFFIYKKDAFTSQIPYTSKASALEAAKLLLKQ